MWISCKSEKLHKHYYSILYFYFLPKAIKDAQLANSHGLWVIDVLFLVNFSNLYIQKHSFNISNHRNAVRYEELSKSVFTKWNIFRELFKFQIAILEHNMY